MPVPEWGNYVAPHFPSPPPTPFSARKASNSSALLPPGHSPRLWRVPHTQPCLWLDTVMSVQAWPHRFHYHSPNNSSHAWAGDIKAAAMAGILSGRKWEGSGGWGQDKRHFTSQALVPVQAGDWRAWRARRTISHSSASYSSPATPVGRRRWQTGDQDISHTQQMSVLTQSPCQTRSCPVLLLLWGWGRAQGWGPWSRMKAQVWFSLHQAEVTARRQCRAAVSAEVRITAILNLQEGQHPLFPCLSLSPGVIFLTCNNMWSDTTSNIFSFFPPNQIL